VQLHSRHTAGSQNSSLYASAVAPKGLWSRSRDFCDG